MVFLSAIEPNDGKKIMVADDLKGKERIYPQYQPFHSFLSGSDHWGPLLTKVFEDIAYLL